MTISQGLACPIALAPHPPFTFAERGTALVAVEAISGQTLTQDFFRALERWQELAGASTIGQWLVYGGATTQRRRGIRVLSWSDISELEHEIAA